MNYLDIYEKKLEERKESNNIDKILDLNKQIKKKKKKY